MTPRHLLVLGLILAGGAPAVAQVDPTPRPVDTEPTFPIPTGIPRDVNKLRFEWSPAGVTTRHARPVDGGWQEQAVGRSGGFRTLTPIETTEFGRTSHITRWNRTGSGATGGGRQYEWYIADEWTGTFEVEATAAGFRFSARLTYYPYEGESYGVGFDTGGGPILFVQQYYSDADLAEAYFFYFLPV